MEREVKRGWKGDRSANKLKQTHTKQREERTRKLDRHPNRQDIEKSDEERNGAKQRWKEDKLGEV